MTGVGVRGQREGLGAWMGQLRAQWEQQGRLQGHGWELLEPEAVRQAFQGLSVLRVCSQTGCQRTPSFQVKLLGLVRGRWGLLQEQESALGLQVQESTLRALVL